MPASDAEGTLALGSIEGGTFPLHSRTHLVGRVGAVFIVL
jgi:hypothetical protein